MLSRRAGQHARQTTRRYAIYGLATIAVPVLVAAVVESIAGFHSSAFIAAGLAALAGMGAVRSLTFPRIDRWDRGAAGEEHVGDLLAELEAEGWHAIHDVGTCRGNIDTIVIGPGGIFALEVKSHGGRIPVDRIDSKWLAQAYAQKKWLEDITGRKVAALLVFSRAYLLGRPVSRQRGVTVLPARMLVGHLRRYPDALSVGDARLLRDRLLDALIAAPARSC